MAKGNGRKSNTAMLGYLTLILTSALVSGCAPQIKTRSCDAFKPIMIGQSNSLTRIKKLQILDHNETWEAIHDAESR